MKYSKELKIGVFVVVILTASFFLINYLRGEDIMNKEIELESRYENVEGLVASAPVYIKGYKAGKVSEVVYQPETDDFKVVCSIKKEFKIPQDTRMTIYAVDIMGGKGIRLDLGKSEVMADDGDFLEPDYESGLMDGLATSLTPLLEKVATTLDSLGVTVSGVNRVVSEENTESITKSMGHLEQVLGDVKQIAATIKGKSSEIVGNISDLSDRFTGIAEKVDTTVTGVNGLMDSLNQTDIEGAVASLKSLLDNINDPDGTVGKLLNEDSVYNSVDSLLVDIDNLIKKIQENPKKYIKISVF